MMDNTGSNKRRRSVDTNRGGDDDEAKTEGQHKHAKPAGETPLDKAVAAAAAAARGMMPEICTKTPRHPATSGGNDTMPGANWAAAQRIVAPNKLAGEVWWDNRPRVDTVTPQGTRSGQHDPRLRHLIVVHVVPNQENPLDVASLHERAWADVLDVAPTYGMAIRLRASIEQVVAHKIAGTEDLWVGIGMDTTTMRTSATWVVYARSLEELRAYVEDSMCDVVCEGVEPLPDVLDLRGEDEGGMAETFLRAARDVYHLNLFSSHSTLHGRSRMPILFGPVRVKPGDSDDIATVNVTHMDAAHLVQPHLFIRRLGARQGLHYGSFELQVGLLVYAHMFGWRRVLVTMRKVAAGLGSDSSKLPGIIARQVHKEDCARFKALYKLWALSQGTCAIIQHARFPMESTAEPSMKV